MKFAELVLIIGIIVVTALALFLLVPGGSLAAAEIVTLRLIQLAVMLISFFVSIFCLHGTKYDVMEQIFERDNMAAALFVSALMLSISGVIGK